MNLCNAFTNMGIEWVKDESLKKYSTFRVGGSADYVVFPKSEEELTKVFRFLSDTHTPYVIVGNGSNILFSDKGFRGVVISIRQTFKKMELQNSTDVYVQAGVSLTLLCQYAAEHSLSGLEFAYGIPGLVGGAIYMNAGAYGGEISQVLKSCRYLESDGSITELEGKDFNFGYRTSIFQQKNGIILSAVFSLKHGNREDIKRTMEGFMASRESKQPLDLPSCGSTFKRPEGYYAGQLIQDAQLRGAKIGGAQVSEKHCGFIVNTGSATASDIVNLIHHVQAEVFNKSGVKLMPEVRIISEYGTQEE